MKNQQWNKVLLLQNNQGQSLGGYCFIVEKGFKHSLNYDNLRQTGSPCQ